MVHPTSGKGSMRFDEARCGVDGLEPPAVAGRDSRAADEQGANGGRRLDGGGRLDRELGGLRNS
jgi:hypothetical protein